MKFNWNSLEPLVCATFVHYPSRTPMLAPYSYEGKFPEPITHSPERLLIIPFILVTHIIQLPSGPAVWSSTTTARIHDPLYSRPRLHVPWVSCPTTHSSAWMWAHDGPNSRSGALLGQRLEDDKSPSVCATEPHATQSRKCPSSQ